MARCVPALVASEFRGVTFVTPAETESGDQFRRMATGTFTDEV